MIWWRRPWVSAQTLGAAVEKEQQYSYRQSATAYAGVLGALFQGKWVSHPEATSRAENKILQLAVARDVGFRVPKPL